MQDLKTGIKIYEWPDGSHCLVTEELDELIFRLVCPGIRSSILILGKSGHIVPPLHRTKTKEDAAIGLAIGLRAPMFEIPGFLKYRLFDTKSIGVPLFISREEILRLETRLDQFEKLKSKKLSFRDIIKFDKVNLNFKVENDNIYLDFGDVDPKIYQARNVTYPIGSRATIRAITNIVTTLGARIGTFEEWIGNRMGTPVGISEEELDLYDAMGVPMPLWSRNYEEAKAFLEEVASRAP